MNNIQKLDLMITNLRELRNAAVESGKDSLAQEYVVAAERLYELMDREIENAAITDDGWSAAEMRDMAGERL